MVYLTFTASRHFNPMMTPISPDALMTQSLAKAAPTPVAAQGSKSDLEQVAGDFEAAFIAQMLNHSGLTDALTSGEGKMAAAFGTFFVEHLAEEMVENGGIGMTDYIYRQLERYDAGDA